MNKPDDFSLSFTLPSSDGKLVTDFGKPAKEGKKGRGFIELYLESDALMVLSDMKETNIELVTKEYKVTVKKRKERK